MLTVQDVLTDKITLDIECVDRVYLNGYVKLLQMPGVRNLIYSSRLAQDRPRIAETFDNRFLGSGWRSRQNSAHSLSSL